VRSLQNERASAAATGSAAVSERKATIHQQWDANAIACTAGGWRQNGPAVII
jgi:hypothetical protein